jgi:glycosyltransferase involved in cell wall biosynthesis
MKVLLVSHGYPPLGVAGVERLTAQTAGELTRRGHEAVVLTRDPSELPATLDLRRDVRDGIPVVSMVGGGSTFERFPVYEPIQERIFERVLTEVEPDAILITHLLGHSPGYVEVAHRWGIPVVMELHDFYVKCPRAHLERRSGELCPGPENGKACASHCFGDQRDSGLRWALRAGSFGDALRSADAVLAPSRFVADAFAAERGDSGPIEIVENAVAPFGPILREEHQPGGPLRLASIGVTVKHKGFETVVEALRLARVPRTFYTIHGVALPPLSHEMQAAADNISGLTLRLANGFNPVHLPVLLADADVVVVPSVVPETYSIVVREAFALGIPVIASRIGALPDAIREGENGWLFEPGNAADLADLLRRLHEEPLLLRRARAGIRSADVTSVEARSDRIEALLERVRSHGARPAGWPGAAEDGLMREALIAADLRVDAERAGSARSG